MIAARGDTPVDLPEPLEHALEAAYGSPGRAYHDLEHVRDVLARFREVARDVGWTHPREAFVALLFHDAVYTAGAHDNEERSAELAREAIARWLPGVDDERVARLIRLTARHGSLAPADVDGEAALFLDCDMAILGSDAATYDAYERNIAREYAAVPVEQFRSGRRRFLERLLATERIFLSAYFHQRLDSAARANLRRWL
jgi:predicted metal-dependent HD superfamily phosphohydrolase